MQNIDRWTDVWWIDKKLRPSAKANVTIIKLYHSPAKFLCFPPSFQMASDDANITWRHHSVSPQCYWPGHIRQPGETPKRIRSHSQTVWTSQGSRQRCLHTGNTGTAESCIWSKITFKTHNAATEKPREARWHSQTMYTSSKVPSYWKKSLEAVWSMSTVCSDLSAKIPGFLQDYPQKLENPFPGASNLCQKIRWTCLEI